MAVELVSARGDTGDGARRSVCILVGDIEVPISPLLAEAGFSRVTVWWEGTSRNGRGNGIFTPETRGEADAGWVAYLIAER